MQPVKYTISLLCLSLVAVLTGCQTYSTGPTVPYGLVDKPLQQTDRIVILDNNIRNTLYLVNEVQGRLPGGQLLVKATFQNRFHQDDVWADVKVEFQDQNSMAIDRSEWVTTLFPAGEVTLVQASSITPNAEKHVLLIRNLRTATGGRITGLSNAIYIIP